MGLARAVDTRLIRQTTRIHANAGRRCVPEWQIRRSFLPILNAGALGIGNLGRRLCQCRTQVREGLAVTLERFRALARLSGLSTRYHLAGMRATNVLPTPSVLVNVIVPPCSSAHRLTMVKPKPLPGMPVALRLR